MAPVVPAALRRFITLDPCVDWSSKRGRSDGKVYRSSDPPDRRGPPAAGSLSLFLAPLQQVFNRGEAGALFQVAKVLHRGPPLLLRLAGFAAGRTPRVMMIVSPRSTSSSSCSIAARASASFTNFMSRLTGKQQVQSGAAL
ncbi:hypothetical protein [Rhodopseudomonas palustris]|uniref:hypothetical protein n=1 Tax=Rhodopseudomonas palustris TaxID=1076 RepID=UPI003D9B01BB